MTKGRTDRQKDRQTDRQTDDGRTDRQTDRQRDYERTDKTKIVAAFPKCFWKLLKAYMKEQYSDPHISRLWSTCLVNKVLPLHNF